MAAPLPQLRRDLSMPGLLETVRGCFARIKDPRNRRNSVRHTLTDTRSAALAMFSLKYPSLLQFDNSARLDEVVRHTDYYQPVAASAAHIALMGAIDRQYLETPRYGSRQMTAAQRHGQIG